MILTWQISTNIEASIIDLLRTEITNQSLTLLDQNGVPNPITVYAGRELNQNWHLPLVQVYLDAKPDALRLEIGSNKRLRSFQMIIDIRTLLPGQETNIADWVEATLNDGITIYDYTPNSLNPDVPAKIEIGYGRIDFITSLPVLSFDGADVFDQNRYRITLKVWING